MTQFRYALLRTRLSAAAAAVSTLVAIAVDANGAIVERRGLRLIERALAHDPTLTVGELTAWLDQMTLMTWLRIGAQVVAGLTFLWWMSRTRVNAETLCTARHRYGRGWVIGGWLVPIVCLWVPFRVIADIWRASRPDAQADADAAAIYGTGPGVELGLLPASGWLRLWWGLWVTGGLLSVIALCVTQFSHLTIDGLIWVIRAEVWLTVPYAVAGVLTVAVIVRITGWQESAHRAVLTGTRW